MEAINMHELRYYQVIEAVAPDVQTLWEIKCKYIIDNLVQSPENLKIYFDKENEWIFDYLPTRRQASQVIAESCFTNFDAVRTRLGMVKIGGYDNV